MKQLTLILFLGLFSTPLLAQKKTETIVIRTTIHCDHCLQCDDCGLNIQRGSRKAKGITKVQIDPDANTITVTYRTNKTSPEKIRLAIASIGYDADNVKADPEAFAKLDSCCKP